MGWGILANAFACLLNIIIVIVMIVTGNTEYILINIFAGTISGVITYWCYRRNT